MKQQSILVLWICAEFELYLSSPGVARDIGHRLLRDAETAQPLAL
jgi:hypothetical protein